MLNGLLVTQIIGPQPGQSLSSPAGTASGDEGVFREMFGGMLGMTASVSGSDSLPAGPGSAVSACMLASQSSTGIQLPAAGQVETIPEIISQLQAAGMKTVEVSIDLSSLGAEQLAFLKASGVPADEGNTTIKLLVAPAALESLKSMLAGETSLSAIPVAVVTGEGEQTQVIPALLTLSAGASEPSQDPELTLSFDPALLAAQKTLVKETGTSAAEKAEPVEAVETAEEEDAGLLREVFDLILSVLGLNVEEKTGQSRATALRELIDKLKELKLYVATKTDPSDKESPEKAELRNLLTGLVKRLSNLQNKTEVSGEAEPEGDAEPVDGVQPDGTVNLSGNDIPGESLDVTLAAVVVICNLLNQMLSGGSLSGDTESRLDFTTLATDMDDVDNQSAQGRRSVLESILSRLQSSGTANSGSGAPENETSVSGMLDILKKLLAGMAEKTDGPVSDTRTEVTAQVIAGSETGSPPAAAPAENGTDDSVEPVPAADGESAPVDVKTLLSMLENLIGELQSVADSGKLTESAKAPVEDAAPEEKVSSVQNGEGHPVLGAAKALLELLTAQVSQTPVDESSDNSVQSQIAAGTTGIGSAAATGNSADKGVSQNGVQPLRPVAVPPVSETAAPVTAPETDSSTGNARPGAGSQPDMIAKSQADVPGDKPVNADGQKVKQTLSSGESKAPAASNSEAAIALDSPAEKMTIPVKLAASAATVSARTSSTQHQQVIMAYSGRSGAQTSSAKTQDKTGPAADAAAAARELGAVVESMSAGLQDMGGEGADEGQDLARHLTAARPSGTEIAVDSFRSELAAPRAVAERPAENSQAAKTLHLINQAEVLEKLSSTARMTNIGGTSEIKIKLEPDNLGSMRVHLSVDENHAVSARIQVESHEARSLIENSLQRLKDALQEQGLKIEKFNVDVRQDQGQQDQQQNASGGREGSWRGRQNASAPDREAVPAGGVSDSAENAEAQAPKNLGYNTLEWVA